MNNGLILVAWSDNRGVKYNADTLYDPATDQYLDWSYTSGRWEQRTQVTDLANISPEASPPATQIRNKAQLQQLDKGETK